ncbi:MAG: hypothetical protein ACREUQ_11085 [Burkholderiales bacterium]
MNGENPVGWLDRNPSNYFVELNAPPAQEPKGREHLHRSCRELVYTAKNRLHFSSSVHRDFTVHLRIMPLRSPVLERIGKSGGTRWCWSTTTGGSEEAGTRGATDSAR